MEEGGSPPPPHYLKALHTNFGLFWEIYVTLIKKSPFVIGLFFGVKKPTSVKDYLQHVVDEIYQLQINGFEFQTKHWNIKIHSVICDTPARAFVKCVKSFSGYHGCDRCEQRGKWEGKMT